MCALTPPPKTANPMISALETIPSAPMPRSAPLDRARSHDHSATAADTATSQNLGERLDRDRAERDELQRDGDLRVRRRDVAGGEAWNHEPVDRARSHHHGRADRVRDERAQHRRPLEPAPHGVRREPVDEEHRERQDDRVHDPVRGAQRDHLHEHVALILRVRDRGMTHGGRNRSDRGGDDREAGDHGGRCMVFTVSEFGVSSQDRRAVASASGHRAPSVRNRRTDRTRRTVIAAFNDLVLRRGFARVTVRDIITHADVGRSTFYEHFENKADVLEQSLAPIFAPLADVLSDGRANPRLQKVVEHFATRRKLALALLAGSTRPIVTGYLARLLEERLTSDRGTAAAVRPLVAAALAAAQIALLEAWLSAPAPSSPTAVAGILARLTLGAAGAVQGEG